MSEVLSGDNLTALLSADHKASVHFMKATHDAIEPAYQVWREDHDWNEVDVPESVAIPPLWRGLRERRKNRDGYHKFEADDELYMDSCRQYGFDKQTALGLRATGLDAALDNAGQSVLFNLPPDELVIGDRSYTHYAKSSLFASQELVMASGEDHGTDMGEITITNVGEGDIAGYQKLQIARLRAQKIVPAIFRNTLAAVSEEFPVETRNLSRAICRKRVEDEYNPLLHTAVEGMMSVGQTVNMLIQPGIEGAHDVPVAALAKSILTNQLPLTASKMFLTGDLGPEQMAGLAIGGLTMNSPDGIDFRPSVIRDYLARKARRKARTLQLKDGLELSLMQRPQARAVNRYGGCPAGAVVRLMSKMLLDALEASEEN